MSSILRCALRRLAPAARSGPSFTAVRRKHSTGGSASYYNILSDEPFDLRTPVTWFAIIGFVVGATFRYKTHMINDEKWKARAAILKD